MAPPQGLTAEEVRDLRSRMCGHKRAMAYEQASQAAWCLRHIEGEPVNAYPCPFPPHNGEHVWHVGHAPPVERMRLLARYLRFGADG